MSDDRPSEARVDHGRPWIDPLRWSALVRAHALFLAIVTATEHAKAATDIFAAWLPEPSEKLDRQLTYLAIIALPLALSYVLTGAWLLLHGATRVRDPKLLSLLDEALAPAKALGRRPRLLTARVAQPLVISIAGVPFLIVARTGDEYFKFQLGQERGPLAFRAVIAHELGHISGWDDLLFFPWFTYLLSASAVVLAGFGLAATDHLAPMVPFSHALRLAGVAAMGVYVVRRREAFSDVFAAITMGSEAPIRFALDALDRGERESSLFATHFSFARRRQWLDSRGCAFLNMSRTDLGLFALVYLTMDGNPLSPLLYEGTRLGSITWWFDSLASFALAVLGILAIAGMTLARGGCRLPSRDLIIAATVCFAGKALHDLALAGFVNVLELGISIFSTAMDVMFELVPFVLIVLILRRWSLGILVTSGTDPKERIVFGAMLIAGLKTALETGTRLVFTPSLFEPLLRSFEQDALRRAVADVSFVLIPSFALQGAFLVGLGLWAYARPDRCRALQCDRCGAHYPGTSPNHPLALICACGASLRPDLAIALDQRSTRLPKMSQRTIALVAAVALVTFAPVWVHSGSDLESPPEEIQRSIRAIGPVEVMTIGLELPLDPAEKEESSKRGFERRWLGRKDKEAERERGPIRVDVHWDTARSDWLRRSSICDFIEAEYAERDAVVPVFSSLPLPTETSGSCQFVDANGNSWSYTAGIAAPRCERHAIVVTRTPFVSPDMTFNLDPDAFFRNIATEGGRSAAPAILASFAKLRTHDACKASQTALRNALLAALFAAVLLTAAAAIFAVRISAPSPPSARAAPTEAREAS